MSYCLIVFNLMATPTSWVYKSIPATNWIPRTSKNMSRMLHGYEKYTHVTSGDLRMQDSPLLFLTDPFIYWAYWGRWMDTRELQGLGAKG